VTETASPAPEIRVDPETDLVLHRVLEVPRPQVWKCWTAPELLKPWFVPRPHSVTEAVIDLRPGGRFFTRMLVEGQEYPSDGCILEVVPGTRLVFTDLMLSDWRPVEEPGMGFTAVITLRDHPRGTEYTALARHRSSAQAERHEAMGFSEGWSAMAAQLEDFARTL
jgi:uncharacterized protein YndB with AHSA1/START domain